MEGRNKIYQQGVREQAPDRKPCRQDARHLAVAFTEFLLECKVLEGRRRKRRQEKWRGVLKTCCVISWGKRCWDPAVPEPDRS